MKRLAGMQQESNKENSSLKDELLLVRRLQEGDREAFAELYRFYQPRLERFLLPFKDISDPESIIHDVFLKLWFRREALVGLRSFENYIFRMAKNRLIDLRRSEQARASREKSIRFGEDVSPAPYNLLEYKEFYEVALEAIGRLPERQQQIYRLSVFQNYSLDEIAAEMNVSKAVVIKQLYLAARFVRSELRKNPAVSWMIVLAGISLALSR